MADVRYFKLKNSGGFVVRMQIKYGGNQGADSDGNVVHFAEGTYEESGYRDICIHAERTIDLNGKNIPNGADVWLKADVIWGNDKEASERFTYRDSASDMAVYEISGTTQKVKLQKK